MNIPDPMIYIGITSAIGIQGWLLKEVVEIKSKVAALTATQNQNMKFTTAKKLAAFAALFVPALFMGCATGNPVSTALDKTLLIGKQIVTSATNVTSNPVVSTDPVTAVVSTNFVTSTNYVTETNTVYAVKPGITQALDIGQFAAPLIPPPFSLPIQAGLGVLSGLLALYVRKKNGEKQSLEQQLTAVVQGVETVADTLPEGNQIKATIQEKAKLLGVTSELHKFVKTVTLFALILFPIGLHANETNLVATIRSRVVWDSNSETNLAGYRAYVMGNSSWNTNQVVLDIPAFTDNGATNRTEFYITNAVAKWPNDVYVCYLTAYNLSEIESDPSNAVYFFWYGQKPNKLQPPIFQFTRVKVPAK